VSQSQTKVALPLHEKIIYAEVLKPSVPLEVVGNVVLRIELEVLFIFHGLCSLMSI